MAESLLAILLVTSSAEKSTVAIRWPDHPRPSPRLVRQRPIIDPIQHGDIPWRASHYDTGLPPQVDVEQYAAEEGFECEWRRPGIRSARKSRSRPRHDHEDETKSPSGRSSPLTHFKEDFVDLEEDRGNPEYVDILGFTTKQLGRMLSPPKRSLCHQKFELVIDDLVFIGHPVCRAEDGVWKYSTDETSVDPNARGRDTRTKKAPNKVTEEHPSPLHSFHFVLVLDNPDPSSAALGNLSKYFDQIYEHVVIPFTAMLFQEQVSNQFVDTECTILSRLEEDCIAAGQPYEAYISSALAKSCCLSAMQALYHAIKSSSIAEIHFPNGFTFEIQLPPYLDDILHTETTHGNYAYEEDDYEKENDTWGPTMNFGWRLPPLTPWKSLLLFDVNGQGVVDSLRDKCNKVGIQITPADVALAENVDRFLQEASITLTLRDMGTLLDWPLETRVYPVVRWLIFHRRAKLVDVVHRSLKNVFALPAELPAPLSQLSATFRETFGDKDVPSLPEILARLSIHNGNGNSTSHEHFYSIFVKSHDRIPIFFDVVFWLLKHDVIQALHLRVRVVVTKELKQSVYREAEQRRERRVKRHGEAIQSSSEDEKIDKLGYDPLSPATGPRRSVSKASPGSVRHVKYANGLRESESTIEPAGNGLNRTTGTRDGSGTDSEDIERGEDEIDDAVLKLKDECNVSTILYEPGRATAVQRRWLKAMSADKEKSAAALFDKIHPYFNGKMGDDEILFKADISRKQLRHVLHHFDEYLDTVLHP